MMINLSDYNRVLIGYSESSELTTNNIVEILQTQGNFRDIINCEGITIDYFKELLLESVCPIIINTKDLHLNTETHAVFVGQKSKLINTVLRNCERYAIINLTYHNLGENRKSITGGFELMYSADLVLMAINKFNFKIEKNRNGHIGMSFDVSDFLREKKINSLLNE